MLKTCEDKRKSKSYVGDYLSNVFRDNIAVCGSEHVKQKYVSGIFMNESEDQMLWGKLSLENRDALGRLLKNVVLSFFQIYGIRPKFKHVYSNSEFAVEIFCSTTHVIRFACFESLNYCEILMKQIEKSTSENIWRDTFHTDNKQVSFMSDSGYNSYQHLKSKTGGVANVDPLTDRPVTCLVMKRLITDFALKEYKMQPWSRYVEYDLIFFLTNNFNKVNADELWRIDCVHVGIWHVDCRFAPSPRWCQSTYNSHPRVKF